MTGKGQVLIYKKNNSENKKREKFVKIVTAYCHSNVEVKKNVPPPPNFTYQENLFCAPQPLFGLSPIPIWGLSMCP